MSSDRRVVDLLGRYGDQVRERNDEVGPVFEATGAVLEENGETWNPPQETVTKRLHPT